MLRLREPNRALLARQLLLERRRLPVVRAVVRLVALQAQYSPSPYVALWSRVDGFRKEQLTRGLANGTVAKGGVMRGTLHLVTRDLSRDRRRAHRVAARTPEGNRHRPREPLASADEGSRRVVRGY